MRNSQGKARVSWQPFRLLFINAVYLVPESRHFLLSKMSIGKDGSFARITSTFKGITPSCKLVEVPEEERKETGLFYKLAWIGRDKNESELSEKSDSDDSLWSDEDACDQFPVENAEKSEDVDLKAKVPVESNEPVKKSPREQSPREQSPRKQSPRKQSPRKQSARSPKTTNIYRRNHNQTNCNSAERKNTSNKSYSSTYTTSTSNIEEIQHNYKANNSFGGSSNFKRDFQPIANSPNDIEPWYIPPVMLNTFPYYPNLPMYPYRPAVEHMGPSNSSANKPRGILGDSPYDHHSPNFQSNSFMYGGIYRNTGGNQQYENAHSQTYYQRRKSWNKNRKRNRARRKNARKQNRN